MSAPSSAIELEARPPANPLPSQQKALLGKVAHQLSRIYGSYTDEMEAGWRKRLTFLPTWIRVIFKIRSGETVDWRLDEFPNGFPRFSRFIATDKDKTALIFKRFDGASARNLLHLEARVAALEAAQNYHDKLDNEVISILNDTGNSDPPAKFIINNTASSWEFFAASANSVDVPKSLLETWRTNLLHLENGMRYREGRNSDHRSSWYCDSWTENPDLVQRMRDRWEVAQALKDALKEYHEAILLYSQVARIESPAKRTIETVEKWFNPPNEGLEPWERRASQFHQESAMKGIFGHSEDLLSLKPPADDDKVSRWLSRRKFVRWLLYDVDCSEGRIRYVPERRIGYATTLIAMIAAMGWLIAAVWALWNTHKLENKLFYLSGFVIGFALWIALLTTASRMEVFGATAAYAAVLIVFVSPGPTG